MQPMLFILLLWFEVLAFIRLVLLRPFSVHVRLECCSVSPSLAAVWMAAGASGAPGQNARTLAAEESSSGGATVTTRPLRVAAEAALDSLSSRETATHTYAQVKNPSVYSYLCLLKEVLIF